MRYLLFFVFMMFGCKSTKTNFQQELKKNVNEVMQKVDSISLINQKLIKEIQSNKTKESTRLFLTPLVDSNGVLQPIEYSELSNGIVTRQINLKGGSLEELKEQLEESQNETLALDTEKASGNSSTNFQGNTTTEIDTNLEAESDSTGGGFWARFKLWIIIVLLLVLLFLSWRLKLF